MEEIHPRLSDIERTVALLQEEVMDWSFDESSMDEFLAPEEALRDRIKKFLHDNIDAVVSMFLLAFSGPTIALIAVVVFLARWTKKHGDCLSIWSSTAQDQGTARILEEPPKEIKATLRRARTWPNSRIFSRATSVEEEEKQTDKRNLYERHADELRQKGHVWPCDESENTESSADYLEMKSIPAPEDFRETFI